MSQYHYTSQEIKERVQAPMKNKQEEIPNTNYIVVCRYHWSKFLFRGVLALYFTLVAVSCLAQPRDMIGFIVNLIVASYIIVFSILSWRVDYLAISQTEIVGHRGVLRSREIYSPISKVQNIALSSNFFGRIMGRYDICVDNAGTSDFEFKFRGMRNAKEFLEAYRGLSGAH